MTNSIFEKILYGIKVANDNIIVLNDKMDDVINALSYDDSAPKDNAGANSESIGGIN